MYVAKVNRSAVVLRRGCSTLQSVVMLMLACFAGPLICLTMLLLAVNAYAVAIGWQVSGLISHGDMMIALAFAGMFSLEHLLLAAGESSRAASACMVWGSDTLSTCNWINIVSALAHGCVHAGSLCTTNEQLQQWRRWLMPLHAIRLGVHSALPLLLVPMSLLAARHGVSWVTTWPGQGDRDRSRIGMWQCAIVLVLYWCNWT